MKQFFKSIFRAADRVVSEIEWQIHSLYRKVTKGKKRKHLLRDIILIGLTVIVLFSTGFMLWAASLKTPDLSSFDDRLLGQSAKLYDRTGKVLLFDLSQKVRRTVVPFNNISPYLKNATIAIEDAEFYNHGGIRATSIIRAILANILSLHFSQGGSTITQQVVKNSLLNNNKDISRKLKEWILAIKLEQTTDKDTILNLYLNQSPYGGNIYGVEEASQAYFAKKSSDLTLAESAYVAALPQSPTVYSPYGKNKQQLEDRKNLVLKKMFENKMISEDEYTNALKEQVVFQPKAVGSIKAPHFVMYIKDYLIQKYGDKMLESGGFNVTTSIDWDLQQKMEQIVGEYVKKNEKTFKASNGAMVAVDPRTGQILAMVGSRDYFDKDIDGNFNVSTAKRQPGSSFKPFVYATAFNKGFTPDTPIYDVPTQFNASCDAANNPLVKGATCYNPQNYEGGFKGLMSLRQALAQSRNVPAVRLLHLVGISDSIKTAEAMGISGLGSASDYGLSLALGGAEVSLLDMTEAYGVFANGGNKTKPTGILQVKSNDGIEIESFSTSTQQVIPQQTALLVDDVLADPYARSSIFGSRYFGDRQVAVKTGTTNSSRDAWEIGYTPSIAIGAWMGNNNNTPMVQKASATIIGPMWKQFADYAFSRLPADETFTPPEPTASSTKPFLRGVWQGPGNEVHSELFWINRSDPSGAAPAYGSRDPLFKLFENGVLNWAGNQGLNVSTSTSPTTGATGSFSITNPAANGSIDRNGRTTVSVAGTNGDTSQVEYYVNGLLIGKSTEAPFSFSFIPSTIPGIQDEDELRAVATQKIGKYLETKIFFSIR